MSAQMINTDYNIVEFPRESGRLDLDALTEIEPDVLLADSLSEQFGLETLPFDLIDRAEREARIRIAELDQTDPPSFHAQLRAMSEQAFAAAIAACRRARLADNRAARLRANAATAAAKQSTNQYALDSIATQAETHAAIATLEALAESHRARGIDAAVSLKLIGVDHSFIFGLVEIF